MDFGLGVDGVDDLSASAACSRKRRRFVGPFAASSACGRNRRRCRRPDNRASLRAMSRSLLSAFPSLIVPRIVTVLKLAQKSGKLPLVISRRIAASRCIETDSCKLLMNSLPPTRSRLGGGSVTALPCALVSLTGRRLPLNPFCVRPRAAEFAPRFFLRRAQRRDVHEAVHVAHERPCGEFCFRGFVWT